MSEWMEMVGKFSDREVARRFGVSASKVRRYRLKTKISYCVNPEIPDGLADGMISMTNYQLCRKFGVSMAFLWGGGGGGAGGETRKEKFPPPRPGFWTDGAVSLLGTMPDPELADRLGISRFPVKQKRQELGIAPYRKEYPEISAEIAAEFGVVSDGIIAKRLGVSTSFVQRARKKWLDREVD
ncbi:hypothetical protein N1Z36_00007530 [Pseudomonas aeruginosa]